ncbi:mycothiol conjugate amidase Mca [Aeromicrobium sp. UC242_57]|uniref:mycothiol conjugate amidase Mca n=1 Tax=Aeromicrobium sp. UC242_57 TaxID=3374624 RepID=UPI00378CC7A3
MHVHAHPDDESSKGAASTAKYVAEGVDVHVVTCTGGERGSILNPQFKHPGIEDNPELITEIRREEMDRAREILGVTQDWLGFVDSGWPEGDPKPPLPEGCFGLVSVEDAAEPLVRLIRSFKPHVLTTYDENGGVPAPRPHHVPPDQRPCVRGRSRSDPLSRLGEPWQVSKLYYHLGWLGPHGSHRAGHGTSRSREPVRGAVQGLERKPEDEARLTTRVECAEYFPVRDAALLAHATQIDPEGWFFAVPHEVQAEAWPTEDYQLVDSKVETSIPETDLFAGLR